MEKQLSDRIVSSIDKANFLENSPDDRTIAVFHPSLPLIAFPFPDGKATLRDRTACKNKKKQPNIYGRRKWR